MKDPNLQASRWLKQAEHDLVVSQTLLRNSFYSDGCFMSEQMAKKAVKAFLFAKGERVVAEQSLKELMMRAQGYDQSFESLLDAAGILDQHYLSTRYPDALAFPGIPYEIYTEQQAGINLVRSKVG